MIKLGQLLATLDKHTHIRILRSDNSELVASGNTVLVYQHIWSNYKALLDVQVKNIIARGINDVTIFIVFEGGTKT